MVMVQPNDVYLEELVELKKKYKWPLKLLFL
jgi:hypothetical protein